MNPYAKGLIAGLVATIVLSLLMLLKAQMGMLPQLDVIGLLAAKLGGGDRMIGWLLHFVIGIVYGLVYAAAFRQLPGASHVVKALVLATVGWLAMMVAVLPWGGAGFFGMALGIMAPIATLVLHWIFGAVLGFTYGKLK